MREGYGSQLQETKWREDRNRVFLPIVIELENQTRPRRPLVYHTNIHRTGTWKASLPPAHPQDPPLMMQKLSVP